MRIARVKGKSVNVMENASNAENIMLRLNVRYLLPVKKKKERTVVPPKTLFPPKLLTAGKPQQIIHAYNTTMRKSVLPKVIEPHG